MFSSSFRSTIWACLASALVLPAVLHASRDGDKVAEVLGPESIGDVDRDPKDPDKPAFGEEQKKLVLTTIDSLNSYVGADTQCAAKLFHTVPRSSLNVASYDDLKTLFELARPMPYMVNERNEQILVSKKGSILESEHGIPGGLALGFRAHHSELGFYSPISSFEMLEALWIMDAPGTYITGRDSRRAWVAMDNRNAVMLPEDTEINVLEIRTSGYTIQGYLNQTIKGRLYAGWMNLAARVTIPHNKLVTFQRWARPATFDDGNPEVDVYFLGGSDFRNCWGDMADFGKPNQRVCGDENLEALRSKVDHPNFVKDLKVDEAGQGGSKIVFAADFVVKSASLEEYHQMMGKLPEWSANFMGRETRIGGCISTSMAPICATFVEPRNPNGETVFWLFMRAIKLSGRTAKKVRGQDPKWNPQGEKGGPTNWFDLKGPIWSQKFDVQRHVFDYIDPTVTGGVADGKTALSYAGIKGDKFLWRNKDLGFRTVFGGRIDVDPCRAAAAFAAFTLDARMLGSSGMTDYSAFLQLYEGEPGDENCECPAKPTFPVVLRIKGEPLTTSTMMAIGVLDYLETTVKGNHMHLSTMKEPEWYNYEWLSMFKMYHADPRGKSTKSYFNIEALLLTKDLQVGSRVMVTDAFDDCVATGKYINCVTPVHPTQKERVKALWTHVSKRESSCTALLHGTEGTVSHVCQFSTADIKKGLPCLGYKIALDDPCDWQGTVSGHGFQIESIIPIGQNS